MFVFANQSFNTKQMYADAVVREMLGRPATSPFLEMVVRRDHLISDTLERLADLETRNSTRAFRKKLKVGKKMSFVHSNVVFDVR
jgi:hypothetical protein